MDEYNGYSAQMRKFEVALDEAKRLFMEHYDEVVAQAQTRLGDLFDPDDYPPRENFHHLIDIEWKVWPVPEGEHFVANLAAHEVQVAREKITEEIANRVRGGVESLFGRIRQAVESMQERLDDGPEEKMKIFRNTLTSNLRNACEMASRLNITGDGQLS